MKPLAALTLSASLSAALTAGLFGFPAPAAAAEPEALRACRAISDASQRLACYDALPLPPVAQAAAQAPVKPAMAPSALTAPAAPAATIAATAPRTATPAATALPAAPAKPTEAEFGLEAQRAAEITAVSSRIEGVFDGWGPSTRFKLANGQVWQVTDGSSAAYYLKDPKVTVSRAALGSFRLEIEGARQAPRVRRVE